MSTSDFVLPIKLRSASTPLNPRQLLRGWEFEPAQMPRSREAEMPQPEKQQRQSPRSPLHLKTTSSDSNGGVHTHHRRSSPKLEGNHRRSPRSPLHELPGAVNQKKRGTRVADLETKLGHAKEELRKLKEQLASAEAAKKDAQHELEETKRMIPSADADSGEQVEEETQHSTLTQEKDEEPPTDAPPLVEDGTCLETPEKGGEETPVVAAAAVEDTAEEKNEGTPVVVVVVAVEETAKEKEEGTEEEEPEAAATSPAKPEAAQLRESHEKKAEMFEEGEFPGHLAENASLKRQLSAAEAEAVAARAREEEMALKLSLAGEELVEFKCLARLLRGQLEAAEAAKASLEAEMRRMKVQTEQWRKAAEAAAAVLSSPGEEARGPRAMAMERRASTDEHISGIGYEGGGDGFSGLWSPLAAVEPEDGLGRGRRKGGTGGGGIRVFGDLWKRRGQQQQQHRI